MAQNPQGFSNEIPMVAIPSEESCESSAGVPLLAGEQREEAERAPSPTSEDSVSTIAPETATELCEYYPWISKAKESRAFAILKEWFLESLALLFSISSFMAIVILLSTHNGQVQPDFVDQISINALVAIFSTVLRASVLFIVTEAIGELKWQWMESPRSLRDMEYFTNAGTGPWGSLKFLFFSWKPTWTVAGAFVVIASAAIGPFSQQASATYPCSSTVKGSAEIRFAKTMSAVISSEMRGAAIGSLLNGGIDSSSVTANLFKCPAESCTFEDDDGITHTSVGICSSCTEASASLNDVVQSNNTDSLDDDSSDGRGPAWPSGLNESYAFKMTTAFKSASESRGVAKLARQDVAIESLHNENMTVSIRALTLSSSMKGVQRYRTAETEQPLGILGIDCKLFPCIKRYNGQVANGTFNETVISQTPMPLVSSSTSSSKKNSPGNDREFMQFIEPCFIYGEAYNFSTISNVTKSKMYNATNMTQWNSTSKKVPFRCLGIFGYSTYSSIQSFVDEKITGSCSVSSIGNPPSLAAVDCGDKWWLDSMFSGGEASFDSVADAIDGMATSITNVIRINGLDWDGRTGAHITGLSSKPAVCVQVYWAWLLYPGVILILTTMLFIRTGLQSNLVGRRRPVWKSNILPLVFYNVKEEKRCSDDGDAQHDATVPLLTLEELGAVANQTVVWFDNDADAPGFVTKTGESGLKSVLVDLKENGVSVLSRKKRVQASEKSRASGTIDLKAWLRRRRATGDDSEP
ncbi:hypothetical protein GQ607_010902 [Colletotrichum asianum]|uniref:Uncharacterized protein n=1 Tax=Colletotrichum asianum TaxID=702518 RepID=A0A8H3WBT7_9PEZI|nr:hypothetical protein GQ607_010902 [Colletotrichum asianum]